MNRSLLMCAVLLALSPSGFADRPTTGDATAANGTYILEVATNLNCAQLDIELRDQASDQIHTLTYGAGAFGAVALPAGSYAFGEVSCVKPDADPQVLDALQSTLTPIEIASGQAYFGGRLVIQETDLASAETPDIVDNCIRGTGRFRKEPNDRCRDGIGIDGAIERNTTVSFYTPSLGASDLNKVRTALGADDATLMYQPIKAVSP